MKGLSVIVLWAIAAASGFACPTLPNISSSLPGKWHEVTKSSEKWRYQQPCGPYLKASDDFDGDGKFDEVFFARDKTNHQFAIFAVLSTQSKPILLTKVKQVKGNGLDTYPEGENERGCSKENGDRLCKPGETIKFTTKFRSVLLFNERVAYYFVWNPELKTFSKYKVWATK